MELDFYVPTGLMIKEYLDMNNMSIEEFAEKLGVTESFAQKLLDSVLPLADDMAEEISKLFGIESKDFIEYEKGYREFLNKKNNS